MTMTAPPRMAATSISYAELLKDVRSQGLLDRRRGYYFLKLGLTFAALGGLIAGVILLGHSWLQLLLAGGIAIALVQIIFLSHDAAHRQIFTSNKANEHLARFMGTLFGGVSLSWWNIKHSRHHAAPNQIAKDPDIDASVVHFFPPMTTPANPVWRFMREHQGWWFYPLLLVEMLNLHAQGVQEVVMNKKSKFRRTESIMLIVRLLIVPALLFVLLPFGMAWAFIGVVLGLMGLYLGVSFAASHIGMAVIGREEKLDFFSRQVLTSRNVKGGRAASWLMGGLNYQIEHHLFPNMPGPNLRKVRPLVRAYCEKHSVAYNDVNIFRAWTLVAQHLNRVGLNDPTSFNCPVVASFRPA